MLCEPGAVSGQGVSPEARHLAGGRRRADHDYVVDADADTVRACAGSLARELREGAAVLEAAGDEAWPGRLRGSQAKLAGLASEDLEDLIETIDGASKAMQALGLHAQAHSLVWSIVDVLVIRDNIHHLYPGQAQGPGDQG